jgi:hypothetical protein
MDVQVEQVDPKRDEEFKLFQEKIKLEDFTEINPVVFIEGDSKECNIFLSLIKGLYPKKIPVIPLKAFHRPVTGRCTDIHDILASHKLFCVRSSDHSSMYLSSSGVKACQNHLFDFMHEHKDKYICLVLKDPEEVEFSPGVQRRLDMSKFLYYKLK